MVCNLDDGEEDPDNDSVDDPDIPNCAGKVLKNKVTRDIAG